MCVNRPRPRALLIHQGAIGDFLVASRVIHLCDDAFGPHRWSYLGKPAHGRLAMALRLIDHVDDFSAPGWHLLFSPTADLPDPMRQFLSSFDRVINLIGGPNTLFSKRLEQACPGAVAHANPKPPETFPDHVLRFQARQLSLPLGPLPTTAYPVDPQILDTTRDDLATGNIDPARLVLLHPGASSGVKRHPLATFRDLADRAQQRGYQPGVLMGEVELEQFSKNDIEQLKSIAIPFIGWPLDKLAALLALARLYIGNDNGISHLAGCVGTRTRVMFIKHNHKIWHPLGPRVRVFPPKPLQLNERLTEEK